MAMNYLPLMATIFEPVLSPQVEQRGIPCTPFSKGFYTNQGVYIIILAMYIYLNTRGECNSAKGGGCSWPQSSSERRKNRILKSKIRQERTSEAAAKERLVEAAAKREKAQRKATKKAEMVEDVEEAALSSTSDKVTLSLDESFDVLDYSGDVKGSEENLFFAPVRLVSTLTNLITGGGVSLDDDEENAQNKNALTPSEIFVLLDDNGDGELSIAEVIGNHTVLGLTKQEAADVFKKLDTKGNNTISRPDFEKSSEASFMALFFKGGINRLGVGVSGKGKPPTVSDLFDLLDDDGNGELSLQEVVGNHKILSLSESEAADLFKKLDPLGKGTISRAEFQDSSSLLLLGGLTSWVDGMLGFGGRPPSAIENRKQEEKVRQNLRPKTTNVGASVSPFGRTSQMTSLGTTL